MEAIARIRRPRWLAFAGFAIALGLQPVSVKALVPPGSDPIDVAKAEYRRLIDDGEYLEAADAIKRAIALLLTQDGYDRIAYGRLLTLLAEAQLDAGALETAAENFELAIEHIEFARDRLSGELVEPLLGLSRAYMAAGRYVDAVDSYRRTIHVHQVNTGLHGEEKARIVAELSEAYYALGDYDMANDMQEAYAGMIAREYPDNGIARLPSLYSRAEMLVRTGENFRSVDAYRRIIALIENEEGPNSLNLIPAMTAISNVLATNRIADGEDGAKKARRYLRRALAITEKNETADARTRAEMYITMGDFLSTQTPNRDDVVDSYQRGWELLSGNNIHDVAYRDQQFARPRLLNAVPSGTPAAMADLLNNAADNDLTKNGHVIVRYDVTPWGRPDNVEVIESVPEGLHDYIVRNHVEGFAFRPRFVDGQPVETPDQVFEIRFSWSGEDLPPELRHNTPEVAARGLIE